MSNVPDATGPLKKARRKGVAGVSVALSDAGGAARPKTKGTLGVP